MSVAAARPRPQAAPDPFGARGPKLAVLLGAPRGGRALAAGAALAAWGDDLAAWFAEGAWRPRPEVDSTGGYDLVAWAPSPEECGAELERALASVRRALSPAGTLLLLAPNALSLRALAHGAPGLLRSGARTRGGYGRALRGAGFESVLPFLATPTLEEAEEFAAAHLPPRLAPDAGLAERGLAAAGLFPAVNDGFAFLASGPGGGVAPLLAALGRALPGCDGRAPVLERFALRDRGALVLHVRAGAAHHVCRAAGGEAAREIARNAEWTRRLHGSALSPWLLARVPAPVAEIALDDETRLFAESAIEGVIGWRLAPALHPTLAADLARFATDLHRGTAAARRLDAAALDRLLPPRLPAHAAGLQRAYAGVRAALLHRVVGRERTLSWAHGDFGPGNALADPASGGLTGVIDWEGAGEDLAGVDLLNCALQSRHVRTGEPAPRAFERAAADLAAGGFAALGAGEMDALLPLSARERAELAAWTALRHVRRSARYPRLFAGARGDAEALLRAAGRLLARSEEPS